MRTFSLKSDHSQEVHIRILYFKIPKPIEVYFYANIYIKNFYSQVVDIRVRYYKIPKLVGVK